MNAKNKIGTSFAMAFTKTIMIRFFTFSLLLLCLGGMRAQSATELFERGNEAYRNEDFEQAIQHYQQILEDKQVTNAALYFNLGNAYFKTGQLAEAILHYEKAAQLNPRDEEIRQNLSIARQKTVDQFETMPQPLLRAAYLFLIQLFKPDVWAKLAVIMAALFFIASAGYFFTRYKRPAFVAASAGLILGTLSVAGGFLHHQYQSHYQPAIVMSASSYVKSGPADSAEDAFILHEGTKVQITENYEGWRKIRLPDGKIGWIKREDVKRV